MTKRLFTLSSLFLVFVISACDSQPRQPSMDSDSVIDRAELVRQCPGNGIYIYKDPVSKRLVWSNGWASPNIVAPGVNVDEVCGIKNH